jgi:hypothetical protein
MLEIKREHDIASPSNYCEPETQRERDAPHLLPFVVGFAIRNMHTHKQQENSQSKKNKKKTKEREWKRSLPLSMKIVAKKQRRVNASYSGSF